MNKQVILKENIKGKDYQLHLTFFGDKMQIIAPDTGVHFDVDFEELIKVYNAETKTYNEYVDEREERERKRVKKVSRRKLMSDIWTGTKKCAAKTVPIVKYGSFVVLGVAGTILYNKRGK